MPLARWVAAEAVTPSKLNQVIDLLTGVMTDQPITVGNTGAFTAVGATGLTGAAVGGRFVGATASGAPTTGTFQAHDFVVTTDGRVWVCTVAGTPGTWQQPAPPPNTLASNIQPVGTALAAGSTGLAADAGHVHTGAGLLGATNTWTGSNYHENTADGTTFGQVPLTGTQASNQQFIGPDLGGTAANSSRIATFGARDGNTAMLNVRHWREATGTDWSTTGFVLSMDVDNTYRAGTSIALDHNKFFGINTEAPAYLLDIFNPSGTRALLLDSSGDLVPSGYISTSAYVQMARAVSYSGDMYVDSVGATGSVWIRSNNGSQNIAQFNPNAGVAILTLTGSHATIQTSAADYLTFPNGIYVQGGTAFFTNQSMHRGGVNNDSGDLILSASTNFVKLASGTQPLSMYAWSGTAWTLGPYQATLGYGSQARQLFTANSRNDTAALEGDILFNV